MSPVICVVQPRLSLFVFLTPVQSSDNPSRACGEPQVHLASEQSA